LYWSIDPTFDKAFTGREAFIRGRREGGESMIGSRVSRPLLALALFITPNVVLGQSGGPAQDETTPACPTSRAIPPIPANAEKVANAIGIMPLVQRVRVLDSGCSQAGATSVEELALRQQITEAVFYCFP
jgi:hypothetical protein